MSPIPSVTLDTNLLLEYWMVQSKRTIVEQLFKYAEDGVLDLAVTARIREDIPRLPLSKKINELAKLDVQEIGSVTRLDYWVLGRDMLGSDQFVEVSSAVNATLQQQGKNPPDWRDWDHLHAHYLAGRDVFLTWDKRVLETALDLHSQLGIVVMKPEDYIPTLGGSIA